MSGRIHISFILFIQFFLFLEMETKDEVLLDNYILIYDIFYHLEVDDLSLCNDFATTFIVDSFYDISTFKFNPRTSPGFTLGTVPSDVKILLRHCLSLYCTGHRKMFAKIMKHASHFADCCNFENDLLRHVALEYVKLYLKTFDRHSEYRIEPSAYNYQGEGQLRSLKITATNNARTGSGISDLLMFTKYVRNMPKRWECYSVHGHYVGVGPLMYANHSCRSNAEFVSHRTLDKRLRFIWASSLSTEGSNEITVNYGPEYFQYMRCECTNCRPNLFGWFGQWFRFKK